MRARVNVGDVAAFREEVRTQRGSTMDIAHSFRGAIEGARSTIQNEKSINEKTYAQAEEGIRSCSYRIERLRVELRRLEAQLAVTPPTVAKTYTDSEGNTCVSIEPNPAYVRLENEIASVNAKLSTLESISSELRSVSTQASMNITRLDNAMDRLSSYESDIDADARLAVGLLEEGEGKLENIIEVLEEYLKQSIHAGGSSATGSLGGGGAPMPSQAPLPPPVPAPAPVPIPFIDASFLALRTKEEVLNQEGPGYPLSLRQGIYDRYAALHEASSGSHADMSDLLSYDYDDFRREIHANPASISPQLASKETRLNAKIDRCVRPFCVWVYRGADDLTDLLGNGYWNQSAEELTKAAVGKLFTDGSFLSASFEEDDILSSNTFALRIPLDCLAAFVHDMDSFEADRHEVVLPSGLLFEVRGVYESRMGGYRVECDAIGRKSP